jgi:hypothetical protein
MTVLYVFVGMFHYAYIVPVVKSLLANIVEMIPILAFAYVVVFLINYFIKPEYIKRHLGHDSGIKGWVSSVSGKNSLIARKSIT